MRRWVIIAAIVIFCLHGALLLSTLNDWRVTLDSGYHVSLARQYGEHGLVAWDRINFGPGGRPNLQAPLLHLAIGAIGRAVGGTGDDYVLANAILATAQWAAAIATAAFFALTLGGEWAMLLAAALLSGAGYASASFASGIPSGWLFILTPWAIQLFIDRRLAPAAVAASAAIYVHIGGLAMVPLGMIVAAALTRRWGDLIRVGLAIAIITAPCSLHCLRYAQWFSGVRNCSPLLLDPLLDALGLIGLAAAMERPRDNAFLIAWAIAPLAWLFQDPGRFVVQSGLAASVLAAVWLSGWLARMRETSRAAVAALVIALATLTPFGSPALATEAAWAAGVRYPRALDWQEASALAGAIERHGFTEKLVAVYQPALCPAIAVYAPIACEKGHWVEVQPPADPADAVAAASKVYVLPLRPDDPALDATVRRGWLRAWGGAADSTVVTLASSIPLEAASAATGQIVAADAAWLSAHAIDNALRSDEWVAMFSPGKLRARRTQLLEQREHAGRIQIALLVYAAALEPSFPPQAAAMRRAARSFGVIASFLGDGLARGFETGAATARLRWRMGMLSAAAQSMGRQPPPDEEFERALNETVEVYLASKGVTFFERPPADDRYSLSAPLRSIASASGRIGGCVARTLLAEGPRFLHNYRHVRACANFEAPAAPSYRLVATASKYRVLSPGRVPVTR